jgi:hypothetical protein
MALLGSKYSTQEWQREGNNKGVLCLLLEPEGSEWRVPSFGVQAVPGVDLYVLGGCGKPEVKLPEAEPEGPESRFLQECEGGN